MTTEQETLKVSECPDSEYIYHKIKHGRTRTYKYASKSQRLKAKYERQKIEAKRVYLETPEDFKFHSSWVDSEDTIIHNLKIPDEIVVHILLNVPPERLLDFSLVCKRWCNIIKSTYIWRKLFVIHTRPWKPPRRLPWYVFYNYFTTSNYENMITPSVREEFNNSWGLDNMDFSHVGLDDNGNPVLDSCVWVNLRICLGKKRLLQYIIRRFRPTIYLSEIVHRGLDRRDDYYFGNEYELWFYGYREPNRYYELWGGNSSVCYKTRGARCLKPLYGNPYIEKAELFVKHYCPDLKQLCMVRKYYSVAGVKCIQCHPEVKILFDSITKKKRRSREKRPINWCGLGWNW